LQNAYKYTEPGGNVTLTARREGSDVLVSVKDSGIGIPAEMLPGIFDLFTQVNVNQDKSQGGLGIGLTLVKQLVTMHEGTVEAMSEGPNRGSEFRVRLPLASETTEQRKPRLTPRPDVHRIRRRILVVDDNRDSSESLATLLRMLGHETALAFD